MVSIVPKVSGSQVQLIVFFPSFWPITNHLIKTSQGNRSSEFARFLIGQTFQDFDCSFAMYNGFLHVENSSKNSQILWITRALLALLACGDGFSIRLEEGQCTCSPGRDQFRWQALTQGHDLPKRSFQHSWRYRSCFRIDSR